MIIKICIHSIYFISYYVSNYCKTYCYKIMHLKKKTTTIKLDVRCATGVNCLDRFNVYLF